MGFSKTFFGFFLPLLLLSFNVPVTAASVVGANGTEAIIDRISESIVNTKVSETAFVYRINATDGGYFFYILHFDEGDDCRSSAIREALDRNSKNALQEAAVKCKIKGLSILFSEKDLPIRAGYHFDVRLASIPEGFFIYFSSSESSEHFVVINTEHSWIGVADSLIAIDRAGRSELSELALAEAEFSFSEHWWAQPISNEELRQKLSSGEYDLFERASAEADKGHDECVDRVDDGNDEFLESWWRCSNCNSGGPGAIYCSCAASFTSNACSVFCNPMTSYACCRCGAWVNRCSCCSGVGGGGTPFPPLGLPPLPPPWEEEEE